MSFALPGPWFVSILSPPFIGTGKLATYVRWFFVGTFGLLILFTVIMAVYRKFGG